MLKYLTIAAALSLSVASATQAATFTDETAFLAASGDATPHTTGTIPRGTTSRSFTDGLTVSTLGPEMASASVFGGSNQGIDNAILISGNEDLNFAFGQTRFGFGLEIYEAASDTSINGCGVAVCVESTFTFTFINGSTVVGTESFAPANDVVTFFGATFAGGFDRVKMRETSGSNDNERFGGFVSTAAPAPVPLPASALLLLAGVAGLGAMRRRR